MDNKVIIVLNDQQTIEKLAADPSTEIRINNAIIDHIGRRAFHIFEIEKDIQNACIKQIEEEFLTGSTYVRTLRPHIAKLIKEQCAKELTTIIKTVVESEAEAVRLFVKERLCEVKQDLEAIFKKIDKEDFIMNAVKEVVYERLTR